MGSILSAIRDDMDRYEYLCEKYGEEPQYTKDSRGIPLLACYGEHAAELEERARAERDG